MAKRPAAIQAMKLEPIVLAAPVAIAGAVETPATWVVGAGPTLAEERLTGAGTATVGVAALLLTGTVTVQGQPSEMVRVVGKGTGMVMPLVMIVVGTGHSRVRVETTSVV